MNHAAEIGFLILSRCWVCLVGTWFGLHRLGYHCAGPLPFFTLTFLGEYCWSPTFRALRMHTTFQYPWAVDCCAQNTSQ